MKYEFSIMTQEQAENIAFNWHYESEYSFYDMEADKEDFDEFLNPGTRGNSMFAVTSGDELIAFFSMIKVSNHTFDIELGMRPDLTGRGKGGGFLKAAMEFVKAEYEAGKLTLSVAKFNQRAIKAYRKMGFIDGETFMQDTNGSTFEFLKMEYEY
ncbi:GNAT family N-acetyltransferase [Oceanobacillus chungangensis]|uniref:GNAT family N-acetyltransferase n=1 Tax=Oceanobacillus chungangensis TaxID=1229152 RepID=A0A3D8PMH1_9BACI|nr:GNAT family N-acetyltransferase [Oceanobacillus chungangensis]RDW17290.1 GNAT family N-acetyltransferase [Oceanobacillus chungangensis]